MTEVVTDMPRSCSIAIQSDVAWRSDFRAFTVPASWMAFPNSRSFSVMVVLPASGCEMIAKVRRALTSRANAAGLRVMTTSRAEKSARLYLPNR